MLKKRENFNLLDEYAPPLKGRRRQHTRSKAFSPIRQRNFSAYVTMPLNTRFVRLLKNKATSRASKKHHFTKTEIMAKPLKSSFHKKMERITKAMR